MAAALSVPGLIAALVYSVAAIWIVRSDRIGGGGNWISLRGMAAFLVTLPVSGLCERLGRKLDCRRNLDMGCAIGGTAVLVYALVAALVAFGGLLLRLGK